jgi:polyvinyl alcohol dehydrogenase (cytochrome)
MTRPLATFAATAISCLWVLCGVSAAHSQTAEETNSSQSQESHPGRVLFDSHCAQCHERGVPRAPIKSLLKQMAPHSIYSILTKGAMRVQASSLSDQEIRNIVEYLTGRNPEESQIPLLMCRNKAPLFDSNAVPVGTGWGIDAANTRSIPAKQANMAARDVDKLKLKWSFAFPDAVDARSQPAIVGNALFVGSQTGIVYAMDARSGCVYWTFQAAGEIRGAVVYRKNLVDAAGKSLGGPTLFFGDVFANVYAISAETGVSLWSMRVDDHAVARIAGTPVLSKKRIYVPLGSWGEEIAAASPDYACCTFRGSIVALDRATGFVIWKRYTIPTPAVEQYRNSLGKPHFGPSGAGIWSSPAYDETRGLIYFATGNNYSDPGDDNSDAIFAIDAESGDVKWKRQMLANDTHNDGCGGQRTVTCPKRPGPDADFTAPPILLHRKDGKDILLAGQKSGDAFGLDPDTGKLLWHTRTSQDPNPLNGGIWYGMVGQDDRLIVPVIAIRPYDGPPPRSIDESFPASPVNGLQALNAFTGVLLWSAPVSNYCDRKAPCRGVMMAPVAIPGVVFAGSVDGYIRAYASRSGKVLWSFDTAQEFKSLNGDRAIGGAIMGAGAVMVANGMVYVNSANRQKPNSTLLAFSVNKDR